MRALPPECQIWTQTLYETSTVAAGATINDSDHSADHYQHRELPPRYLASATGSMASNPGLLDDLGQWWDVLGDFL